MTTPTPHATATLPKILAVFKVEYHTDGRTTTPVNPHVAIPAIVQEAIDAAVSERVCGCGCRAVAR